MPADRPLAERIATRELVVAVVGLGYVGLPLAVAFADAGFRTVGLDVDPERVERLSTGLSHVDDVADSDVAAVVSRTTGGRLEPTTDPAMLREAGAAFLCVPTPFDAAMAPDLSFVRAAATAVGRTLEPGTLVVLQSTTYPGTTVEVVQPILEATSGLRAGADFHLAYSPERVDAANPEWTIANTPRICGGVTQSCGEAARLVLDAVLGSPGLVTVVSSPSVAELAKLVENTYRAVNIAYVNELAMLADEMGLDIWEVLDAAATKPFGYQPFLPGPGPGGQCIPVNPYYLSWRARAYDFQTSLIELAGDINVRMANYVLHRVQQFANRLGRPLAGARVLCLGAAFKAGVSDVRNSRAVRVMELLEAEGARVEFADPLVEELAVNGSVRKAIPLDAVPTANVDLVVVLVRDPAWPAEALRGAAVPVFDAVNALGAPDRPGHERL